MNITAKTGCKWDLVALGEVMLRFDPGDKRIWTARSFDVYEGGGGDSFASGFIYGLLAGETAGWAIEWGAAHGALAMTTPGDTSIVTLKEVLNVMEGASARIAR